jgi:hypothetical protein
MFYNMFYASNVCWNVSSTTSNPHIQANKKKLLSPMCVCEREIEREREREREKSYCEMIKLKKQKLKDKKLRSKSLP